MEPISVVLAALAVGAGAGGKKLAEDAIGDAYAGFKKLLKRRLQDHPSAQTVLDDYDNNPATGTEELEIHLRDLEIDRDPEVIQAAQEVMARSDARQSGFKYSVNLEAAKGVQVGDGNTQNNRFD